MVISSISVVHHPHTIGSINVSLLSINEYGGVLIYANPLRFVGVPQGRDEPGQSTSGVEVGVEEIVVVEDLEARHLASVVLVLQSFATISVVTESCPVDSSINHTLIGKAYFLMPIQLPKGDPSPISRIAHDHCPGRGSCKHSFTFCAPYHNLAEQRIAAPIVKKPCSGVSGLVTSIKEDDVGPKHDVEVVDSLSSREVCHLLVVIDVGRDMFGCKPVPPEHGLVGEFFGVVIVGAVTVLLGGERRM